MPDNETTTAPAADAATERKSIVPAGWKSKNDELAQFINKQSSGKEGFEFSAFFALCRKNGIAEDKVARYEGEVNDGKHGAPGRAKMTLRNMLESIARKNGKLVGLDDTETAINLAPRVLGGAAAKAKEAEAAKAAEAESAGEPTDSEH